MRTVVTRIGRPEIATDPMGVDMADTYAFLKPPPEWREGKTREDLVAEMAGRIGSFPGIVASFSQPIKFRMMELIEGVGVRSDVVVKLFGDDLDILLGHAHDVARAVRDVQGAEDVKVQQLAGLPLLEIRLDRDAAARHGINGADVHEVVRSAIAGTEATRVLEGFKRFDLVVRFPPWARSDPEAIGNLPVSAPAGHKVPLRQIATIASREGPAEISRENGQRRISVEVNVRGRDLGSFVAEAQSSVERKVKLPPGYTFEWGGTFEHLESSRRRLFIAVPAAFLLVLFLLVATFHSFRQAALVFTGIRLRLPGESSLSCSAAFTSA